MGWENTEAIRAGEYRGVGFDPSRLMNILENSSPFTKNRAPPQQPAIQPLNPVPTSTQTCYRCEQVRHLARNYEEKLASALGGRPKLATHDVGKVTKRISTTDRANVKGYPVSSPLPPFPSFERTVGATCTYCQSTGHI